MTNYPEVCFTEVCDIQGGTQPPKDKFVSEPREGYIRLIQIQDYKRDDKAVFIPQTKQLKLCDVDDVMIARYGASIGQIHRGISGAYNVALVKTMPDESRLSKEFLFQLLESDYFQRFIQSCASRAAQAGFNKVDLERFTFVLPPLEHQQYIARVLEKADDLRTKRRAAIQKLDDLLQSVFLDMFGDPVTNPKGWEIVNLGDCLTFLTSGGRGWAKYYSPSGARFIRSLDVQMNYISDSDIVFISPPDTAEAKRTKVQANDVLLTITGSRIGRVAPVMYLPEDAFISQHVAILRLESSINPIYLSMFLSLQNGGQSQIRKAQYGQTKPGLNFQQIKSFIVPLPPLNTQYRFLDFLQRFEKQASKQNKALENIDSLFHSLQQRAFRGELTPQTLNTLEELETQTIQPALF